jgi:hypothetical protein
MKDRLMVIMLTLMMVIGMVGCAKYYQVKDPTGETVYYTDDIDDAGEAGAIKFEDARTGSEITLQSSEVKEISKEEFEKHTSQ